MYGAALGGAYGYGIIFRISHRGKLTVLYNFTGEADGGAPAAVIVDGEGNLFGVTRIGGTSCDKMGDTCGTVFRLSKDGKFTVRHTFVGGTDGGNPLAALVQDRHGNLYGTASAYGDPHCSCGVVFRITRSGSYTVLHAFTAGADGGYANAPLILDPAGNVYGTTLYGGGFICSG